MAANDAATSPIGLQPTETTSLLRSSTEGPSRPDAIQSHTRLRFEAQRDSAAYHLGVYLDLRRNIWSSIVERVAEADANALGGKLGELSDSVWQFIANRDQVQSDVTILLEMLRISAQRGKKRLAWTSVCSMVLAILVSTRKPLHFERYYHVLNPVLWSAFGISGAIALYYGTGVVLFESKKGVVEALQCLIEEDQLRESDRGLLSGWGWLFLQFTSLL